MIRYGVIVTAGGFFAHYLLTLREKSEQIQQVYQSKKSQFLSNENFGLLYNPFAYLYTFIKEDNIESLQEFQRIFDFYKPKKILIDISNDYYLRRYQDYVKSDRFLTDFRSIKYDIKQGKTDSIQQLQQSQDASLLDVMHLYAFYECYSKKCEIFFAKNDHVQGEIQQQNQLEQFIEKAPESVKKFLPQNLQNFAQKDCQPGNVSLVNQLFFFARQKGTIFTEPGKRQYLALGGSKNIEQIRDLWKLKFRLFYNTEAFDAKDPSITEQMEKEQLFSLRGKI